LEIRIGPAHDHGNLSVKGQEAWGRTESIEHVEAASRQPAFAVASSGGLGE
jgi:hypothetical protein